MTTSTAPLAAWFARLREPRVVFGVAVAVMLLGALLRLLGTFSIQLWCDEALWADRAIHGNWGWIRPVGYMWITSKLLAIANNEPMLRSLSTLAGLAQLPLLYVLLRRVVTSPLAALLGTYLLAISPVAVAMAKEFKPYGIESCLHTLLIVGALAYCTPASRLRWLVLTLGVALVAPLFAWTIIFVYPGVFLVMALHARRHGRWRDVALCVAVALAILAMLMAIYNARLNTSESTTSYWGRKYDVFYVGKGGPAVYWFANRTAAIAALPGRLEWPWPGSFALLVLSVILCASGAVALFVRRQWAFVALLVLPWLLTLLFNIGRQWPYGAFRTNAFLLFYAVVLVAVGADALIRALPRLPPLAARAVAVAGALLVFLTLPFDLEPFRHKRPHTMTEEAEVRTLMTRLMELEQRAGKRPDERRLLVMDGHACRLTRYYRDSHDDGRAAFHEWFNAHFEPTCANGENERRYLRHLTKQRGKSFWLMSARRGFADVTRKALAPYCNVSFEEETREGTFLYRCEATPEAAAAAAAAVAVPATPAAADAPAAPAAAPAAAAPPTAAPSGAPAPLPPPPTTTAPASGAAQTTEPDAENLE